MKNFLFCLLFLLGLALRAGAQQVLIPGYEISVFASGINPAPTKITCDEVNRVFYTTGYFTEGQLMKIDYNGQTTQIASNWAAAAGTWHASFRTEVTYYNGYLYAFMPDTTGVNTDAPGRFFRLDPVSGVATALSGPMGLAGSENGIAVVNDTLFGSPGTSVYCMQTQIFYYDLNTGNYGLYAERLGMVEFAGLTYNRQTDKLYFYNSLLGTYTVNRATPAIEQLHGITMMDQMEVDPTGQFAYFAFGTTNIYQLNLATGAYTQLISGLDTYSSGICFGPSTTGTGYSLFAVTDSGTIYEIKGFEAPVVSAAPEDAPAQNGVQVFPNPFTHQFSVRYTTRMAGTADLQLTDLAGRQVLQQKVQVSIGENMLDLTPDTDLAPGLYVLHLKQGETSRQVKLIRQ